jgi:hypothetical protein
MILQSLFKSAQHIYEQREGSVPLTNRSGSGRSKNFLRIIIYIIYGLYKMLSLNNVNNWFALGRAECWREGENSGNQRVFYAAPQRHC